MSDQSEIHKNYVNILVMATDIAVAKAVQAATAEAVRTNADKDYRVFPGLAKEKIHEYLDTHLFHSILVDEDYVLKQGTAAGVQAELKDLLKKKPDAEGTPIIYLASEMAPEQVRRLVKSGWRDVLLKPLDQSLYLQKMLMYNGKIPFLKESVLFNMDLKKDVDVSFSYQCLTLSEYGMRIESNLPLQAGLVVGIGAEALAGMNLSASVIRCQESSPGLYSADLMFIGLTPAQTQTIRKLVLKQYAEEKQAA